MQDPASTADEDVRAATELWNQGNPAAAELRCRQALALVPRHRDGMFLLGMVLHFEARYAEAEEIFAELALLEPREPLHWINLGTARRGGKRYAEALTAFTRAAQLGAANAEFHYSVGLTHLDRCDFEAARAVLERAAALAPQDAEIRYRYALACHECRHTNEALAALEGWETLPDLTSEVAANIGSLLMNLGEAARAGIALHEASRDPNPKPGTTLTLIQAHERTNRLEEARSLLDRLVHDPRARELGTDLVATQAQLAERGGDYQTAARLLREVLRKVDDFQLRHFQLFRLARCLDALQRYEEAFETLQEAHRSQAAHIALSYPSISLRGIPTMTITKYGCDPADVARWDHAGAPSVAASPVFIVAFPRSGTTLLELTLDAHPLLRSMDEQPFVQNALDDMVAEGVRYPQELGRLGGTQLESIRARYWERVSRKVRLEPGQRLVDKNPLNILRLPVIRRLFPNARVLFAIRHPCDVLLSCYMQHFRAPDFALLCTELETLALGYRRTMDFWYEQVQLLEPAVRELSYESFVRDFEAETRGVGDFLELPWDDGMLAPASHARSKGYISTPSYSQVVQPVSSKSVGRWRAYEKHFAAVLPQLQPYLERWGYEGLSARQANLLC
jgi:tetratricopeptide (TPR) repeat protein